MTWLWVLLIIAGVLFLINLIRFGVEAEYSEDGFALCAHVLCFTIRILPKKPGKKKKEKKKKKPKKPKKEEHKEEHKPKAKRGGTLQLVMQAIPPAKEFLRRFKRHLLINDLTLYFLSASDDAYKAAMNFGYVSAAAGVIVPLLENSFRIRRRDIRTNVSFQETKNTLYAHARLSIALWEVVYASWVMIKFGFSYLLKRRKGKAVNENGKTSDRRTDGEDDVQAPGDGRRQHHRRAADHNA